MTAGSTQATGTPRPARDWSVDAPTPADEPGLQPHQPDPAASAMPDRSAWRVPDLADPSVPDGPAAGPSPVDVTRFAHASEAEMARILDFYAVRWEYEPTTFPILWNLEGNVVESFAPDFYLPELEVFLEMTTLKQRLVRKKNRKLRRLRELYPDIRIKLFYARDFRAMMLKYGRLGLAASLSGTTGQVVSQRAAAVDALVAIDALAATASRTELEALAAIEPLADLESVAAVEPEPVPPSIDRPIVASVTRTTPRTRPGRRRRSHGPAREAGAEREPGG